MQHFNVYFVPSLPQRTLLRFDQFVSSSTSFWFRDSLNLIVKRLRVRWVAVILEQWWNAKNAACTNLESLVHGEPNLAGTSSAGLESAVVATWQHISNENVINVVLVDFYTNFDKISRVLLSEVTPSQTSTPAGLWAHEIVRPHWLAAGEFGVLFNVGCCRPVLHWSIFWQKTGCRWAACRRFSIIYLFFQFLAKVIIDVLPLLELQRFAPEEALFGDFTDN